MISEQIELGLGLLTEIEIALDLAPDDDALRSRCQRSDHHEKTLTCLLDQINECGLFIQSYVKDVKFGTRYYLFTHTKMRAHRSIRKTDVEKSSQWKDGA